MLALASRECKFRSVVSRPREPYPRRVTSSVVSTRETILVVARQRFAERGFSGTSLNDIAEEVGIRTPSLFHHFPSKLALYRAVLLDAFDDWFELMDQTTNQGHSSLPGEQSEGWPQVERVVRTAFRFFVERPDFVRLLEQEMDAGRIRRCDARRLVITGYGAVLSYLSDAPLVGSLLGEDPLAPAALATEQEHVLDLFRHALVPWDADGLPISR